MLALHTDTGVPQGCKITHSRPPPSTMSPTVLGKVVHDRPLSVRMIAHAPGWSSCIMHLPAQYECMPRGAERENGLSGESHMGYTWNREKMHGTGGGENKTKKKTLKPQYDRWRMLSMRERGEEDSRKMRGGWKRGRERERERAAEEERGLAGLPVPPVSWDYLLLQSNVAQQKQREQQNYTHLPARPFPH